MEHLILERRGHVATVTLNRPKHLNALSIGMMKEIESIAGSLRDDLDTRVVVFTGAGKHFSAGRDLKDPDTVSPVGGSVLARQRQHHLGPRMISALREMNQITIAAVNGAALGGAACMVSALDFRIGSEDCVIGYPESALGIPLSWASLPLCIHLVGPARTKRMMILAEKVDARTLLDWGFLDEVVPNGNLMARAVELAETYARRPPVAAQMIKRSVNAYVSALDRAVMHMDSDQVLLAQSTEDFHEGVQAFFEKRDPRFGGR